ncbi:MAG: hypothetical protein JWO51_3511 [Rhodospirillales bacterium]|nr:hypothetical protein [Rhodospirillales bacterium]
MISVDRCTPAAGERHGAQLFAHDGKRDGRFLSPLDGDAAGDQKIGAERFVPIGRQMRQQRVRLGQRPAAGSEQGVGREFGMAFPFQAEAAEFRSEMIAALRRCHIEHGAELGEAPMVLGRAARARQHRQMQHMFRRLHGGERAGVQFVVQRPAQRVADRGFGAHDVSPPLPSPDRAAKPRLAHLLRARGSRYRLFAGGGSPSLVC